MANANPMQNGTQVDILYRYLREDVSKNISGMVKKILAGEMWKEHQFERTGKIYKFDKFVEFVETEPPGGIGSSMDQLLYVCRDDKEALDMIDQVMNTPGYRPPKSVHDDKQTTVGGAKKRRASGTFVQRGLRLLRLHAEKNPEIAELRDKVLAGQITVNAALIKAGLRVRRTSIPIDDLEATANTLRRNFSKKKLNRLIQMLSDEL